MSKHTIMLLILAVIGASCCAGLSPAVAADKIRIGYSGISVSNSMPWVTQDAGIFKANNLDVELLYLQAFLGQSALIAGEIQMGVYSAFLMAPARLQGADVVMILSFVNRLLNRLVVRPEIRTPADLKGKRIGISRFGTTLDWTTRFLISKLGLDPEKDVKIIQIGANDTLTASLISGMSIDAALLSSPYYKRAVAAGMRVLVNMEEMNIPYQQTGLITTKRMIAKSPDIVRRAVKSIVEAIHVTRSNPAIAKKAIGERMKIKDQKELDEAYQILHGFIQTKPYPSIEGFKTILAELSGRLPAARTADPKDFVDLRFLEELDRSGYIDSLYR